ncbi:MAG: ferrous iron transport protein B [Magnetococcales bacterium]|nr:ferrous iron transport protein B [Magnetococcales bacterium]
MSKSASAVRKTITVALAGNPNSGKTTLFNKLTRSQHHVGNFPGVTVSRAEGKVVHRGYEISLVDLPGIYSLSSSSKYEVASRRHILEEQPDIILNVIDAGNLERNLFLTTQLIEMDRRRIYCLNMVDEARKKGIEIDLEAFSAFLDGPVVETVAHTGKGTNRILDAIVDEMEQGARDRRVLIPYDTHLEEAIERLHEHLPHDDGLDDGPSHSQARWLAIKLLEGDEEVAQGALDVDDMLALARKERAHLSRQHGCDAGILFANARYGLIQGLMRLFRKGDFPDYATDAELGKVVHKPSLTDRLDNVLLNRLIGLPIFLLLMWTMFQSTFELGAIPAGWIESLVEGFSGFVDGLMSEGQLKSLLVDGVINGMGSVLVFLPNIVFLFFFIALFEDTGYIARVAFLVDRIMRSLGLQGKTFIPLLMGFGCNVPAIMATRTINNHRDRMVAILINPFISCAARLPVFVLFAGAFFAERAGTVVFSMYIAGIVVALSSAFLLKKTILRGEAETFIMELPPYRRPTIQSILTHMGEPVIEFIKKVSGVILVGSIVIWFLQSYPMDVPLSRNYEAEQSKIELMQPSKQRNDALAELKFERTAEEQKARYLGQIGQSISVLFEPLGLDWKSSVALLTGMVAKEVIVSTMGVMYQMGEEVDEASEGLRKAMRSGMTPTSALAFMVFSLLYMPCLSTIAVIKRETRSWRWTIFSMAFSLVIAYGLASAVYFIGEVIVS